MRIIACSSYVCSSDLVTRRVVARQSVGVILTMSASFQVDEAGHDVQIAAMPEIPGHAELVDTSWSSMFDRRFVSPRGTEEGRGTAWLKMHDPIGDDPVLRSEEHTSELQSLMRNSYAGFCLKKKTQTKQKH